MSEAIAAMRKLTIVAKDPGLRIGDGDGPLALLQVDVPAEILAKGPTGYRIKVVDYNATERVAYLDEQVYQDAKGALADPFAPGPGETFETPTYQARLLANPNFHAQNAYAIAMRTLGRFERALGRRVSWSSGAHRLNVAPHAFQQANAYYSEPDGALMFGYFAGGDGRWIFTCLSHDIVAHETAHALLDGIRTRFTEASRPDQAAFHEGFADIVALLSVFSLEPVVAAALRGDGAAPDRDGGPPLIEAARVTPEAMRRSILLGIARQVGEELEQSGRGALRRSVELAPDPGLIDDPAMMEEHRRGEILVAAVMHAFLALWNRRIEALGRFAGDQYNLDMVVEEGAKLADHLLTMCIRGLDYCPPTDIDFGQYLAAILTADQEIVPDDNRYHYRDTVRRSFEAFGIRAAGPGCDEELGVWRPFAKPNALVYSRSNYEALTRDRNECFRFLWENRAALGISDRCHTEVISVDPSVRLGPDGIWLRETICQYVQVASIFGAEVKAVLNVERPRELPTTASIEAFGGGVVIFDQYGRVKYHIANRIFDGKRQLERIVHLFGLDGLAAGQPNRARFALLHLKRMEG